MSDEAPGRPLTVPVLLDGWQIECCGTPPAVGDTVSWQLHWNSEYAGKIPSTMRLTATLERYPTAETEFGHVAGTSAESVPALATVAGLAVFILAPVPLAEEITLTGVLHEDHHVDVPEDGPVTTGRITAVWLVSWEYRQRENGAYPVEGTVRFEEVAQAPKWMPRSRRRLLSRSWRDTMSVLAELEVASEREHASETRGGRTG